MQGDQTEQPDRYCEACGTLLGRGVDVCAVCHRPWEPSTPPEDVPALVGMLYAAGEWARRGLVDPVSGRRLRDYLEARLSAAADSARAAAAAVSEEQAEGTPRARDVLVGWATGRPVDLLLYLAAVFLVSTAALVDAYTRGLLDGTVRVALLGTGTLGFLVVGLAAQRWTGVREADAVFRALAALAAPFNVLAAYVAILGPRGVSADVTWLAGALVLIALYGLLARRGYGRVYIALMVGAIATAWGALAFVAGVPQDWLPTWYMALITAGAAVLAARGRLGPAPLVAGGTLAIVNATAAAAVTGSGDHWQLAASCALLALGAVIAGWSQRAYVALPVAATIAVGAVIAACWSAGLAQAWAAYPLLAVGALALVTRRWWAHWNIGLARFGWAYAGAAALAAPAVVVVDVSWHRAVVSFGGAALLLAIAWRNRDLGIVRGETDAVPTFRAERTVFGWMAFGLLVAALAATQQQLGIARVNSGWAFLGLTLVLLVALAVLARRRSFWEAVLLPAAVVAGFVALRHPLYYPGHDAVLFGVAAAASVAAAAVARRWVTLLMAAAAAAIAAAAAWLALGWSTSTLAVAYSAAGAVAFALLARYRRYDSERPADAGRVIAVELLSWAGAVGGPVVAAVAMQRHLAGGAIAAPTTPEYRAVLGLVLAIAPLLAIEAWRLRAVEALVAATGVVLAGLLMTVAILDPVNVQAYTVPTGLSLIALGLVIRRSRDVWHPHLTLREATQLAGVAVLIAPQAVQTFDPGGMRWDLILVLEGAIFLAVALVFDARWMAVAGVATLMVAVGIGIAAGASNASASAALGVLAVTAIAGGALLAQQRGWWVDARHRAATWWRRPPGQPR